MPGQPGLYSEFQASLHYGEALTQKPTKRGGAEIMALG